MPPLDEIRSAFLRKPWKRVKNSSGEVVPPFAVMRVVSSEIVDGEVVVTIAKPNTTFLSEYLVNGPWAIGSGSSDEGLATDLSESGLVLYGTGSPAVGEEWGPEPSTWTLKKYRYGFRIKGSTTTFGANLVVVANQFEVVTFRGVTDSSHAKDATGTISVIDGNSADTTLNVSSVLNVFADVATTKRVGVTIWGGTPHLTSAECE